MIMAASLTGSNKHNHVTLVKHTPHLKKLAMVLLLPWILVILHTLQKWILKKAGIKTKREKFNYQLKID